MKILLLAILFLKFIPAFNQTPVCADVSGIIKINNSLTNNEKPFCEGETINISVDNNFDKIVWRIISNGTALAYSNNKDFDFLLPSKNIEIAFFGLNKGDSCYTKSYIYLNNIKPTKRNLLMPDTAYYGQNVVVKQDIIEPDDILYAPDKTIFLFSEPLNLFGFLSSYEGTYRLNSEKLNQACGNQDITRKITYSPIEKQAEISIENSNSNLEYCPNRLLKLYFTAKNLKVINPIFKVYTSDSQGNNKNERDILIVGNQFYFEPNIYRNDFYISLKELNSGATSNVLGPFKAQKLNEKINDSEKLLKLIQKPFSIIAKGDTTEFIVENKSTHDLVWSENGKLRSDNINEEVLKITKSGYYSPVLVAGGACYIDNSFYVNPIEEFENIVPFISVISSCSKQVKIRLRIGEYKISENIILKWKKDGKYFGESTTEPFLYTTENGKYECELWLNSKFITSNMLNISSFSDLVRMSLNFQPTQAYPSYICNARLLNVEYSGDPYRELKNYNWYINDILQDNHASDFVYPTNFLGKNLKVKATIQDGECFLQSETNTILNRKNNNTIDYSEDKIVTEICAKDSQTLDFNINTGSEFFFAKYDWYKDDKLIETLYNDFNKRTYNTRIKVNTPGIYYAIITVAKTTNDLPDYENNTCIIRTENKVVVVKDTTTFNSTIAIFQKQFCGVEPTYSFANFKKKISSFEWFLDGNLLPKSQSKIEETLNSSKISVEVKAKGKYSAIVNFENGCVAKSVEQNYSGVPKLDLVFNMQNCNFGVLATNSYWDNLNKNFRYFWKKDGEIITNKTYNFYDEISKSGSYQMTAIQIDGDCIIESEEKVVVFENSKQFSIVGDTSFCENRKVNLFLNDTTKARIIDWYFNDNIETSKKSNLEIAEQGTYKALISDKACGDYYFSNTLKINELPKPTATISGSKSIDYNQPTDLKFELTSAPPWQIKLNTGEEFSIKESPYTLKVRPLSDIKYSISSVENICGLGTTSGEAVIKVTILSNEKSVEDYKNLKVFPIPVTNAFELEILETNGKYAQIILLNNLGIELQNHSSKSINNQINKTLNINELPAGIYNLKVKVGNKNYARKILKQ